MIVYFLSVTGQFKLWFEEVFENMGRYLVPADIDIGLQRYPIDKVIQMIKYEDIILDKTFRKIRNKEWNQEKKSSLIESLMIQVPIGNFYFETTNEGKYIVIDGCQRLNALNKFIGVEKDNLERFQLSELKYMEEFEGCFWEEVSVPICRRISERYIDVYVLRSWAPEEVKNDIAFRMG